MPLGYELVRNGDRGGCGGVWLFSVSRCREDGEEREKRQETSHVNHLR